MFVNIAPPNIRTKRVLLTCFIPGHLLLKNFRRFYNGRGVRWLFLLAMRVHISEGEAREKLSEIVEDALIGTFVELVSPKQMQARLPIKDEYKLLDELERRIPLFTGNGKNTMAIEILRDLKAQLANGKILKVDGGTISCERGCLVGTRYPK